MDEYFPLYLYLFAILISGVLACFILFYLMQFTDVDNDELDPEDMRGNVNPVVIPEMIIHALLTLGFLVYQQWTALAINVPMVIYNANLYIQRRHLVRPFNRGRKKDGKLPTYPILDEYKTRCYSKVLFFLLSFFYYVYLLIQEVISTIDPTID